jgi:hypothetical protein
LMTNPIRGKRGINASTLAPGGSASRGAYARRHPPDT